MSTKAITAVHEDMVARAVELRKQDGSEKPDSQAQTIAKELDRWADKLKAALEVAPR